CVLACDQLGNLVKDAVARLRPCEDQDMLARGLRMLEGPGGLYGFYSAHAANAMGFAVCSKMGFSNDRSRRYRIYGICITLWALLVGISRVFVGKHFLGDVLAGFAVGLLFGWLCGALGRFFVRKTDAI
ncbi:MAG: phosphatase PAP2 family protein, partial [Bacteroidales bacterium]|nr:phosphatase PAP2 family protein [Bacteroidales bacterium]